VQAPDALIIDKSGRVFSEFGISQEGIREMVVPNAMSEIKEIYRMF